MSAKSMFRIGFLSVIAATALFAASDSFAAGTYRVDNFGTLAGRVAQLDSMKAGSKLTRADVIGSVGSKGPVHSYTKPISH
jgi:hypothetical protein